MFGGGVSSIRGSIAGQTFSKNANGAYIRNRSKPANRNTIAQQRVRNTFGAISRTWKTLTSAQQQSFVDQTPNYPYTNSIGETQNYTGSQLFQKVNAQLSLIGAPLVLDMISPTYIPANTTFSLSAYLIGTAAFEFSATFDFNFGVPDDTRLVVRATRTLSNGTYRPKSQDFKQILVLEAGDSTNPASILLSYDTVFGAPTEVGGFIWVEIFLVSTLTGQIGNAVQQYSQIGA